MACCCPCCGCSPPDPAAAPSDLLAVSGATAVNWTVDAAHGDFPERVGAIAFGGGGFKSVGCFWPVLYHLGKTRDLRALLDGIHIGASSGGGWFFSNLVFNREVWKSISTDKREEDFLSMYRTFFEGIVEALEEHQHELSSTKLVLLKRILGNESLKDILESQGFPLFDETMIRWIAYYINQDNGWKLLNDTLSRGQEATPNADLSLTCDMANGILTKATLDFEDNWLVDHNRFYKVLLDDDKFVAQIPMTINVRVSEAGTTHTITLCQEKQSFDVEVSSKDTGLGFGKCTCRCGRQGNVVEVSKEDIERGCKAALKSGADTSGPTGAYFSCFSQRYMCSYFGITNNLIKGLLIELEHKVLYKSFFGLNALGQDGETICPLRMVDGGPWDHTGIAMAVKGMQREGRSGDLVAITLYSLESYTNFHVMFADFDNQGDHCGIAEPPYPRCFKGLPPTACKAYGKHLQVLDCQVETVDCPAFEIVGGRTYRLFYIFLMPEHLNLFPFKAESVEAYMSWCRQALEDLNLWTPTGP